MRCTWVKELIGTVESNIRDWLPKHHLTNNSRHHQRLICLDNYYWLIFRKCQGTKQQLGVITENIIEEFLHNSLGGYVHLLHTMSLIWQKLLSFEISISSGQFDFLFYNCC